MKVMVNKRPAIQGSPANPERRACLQSNFTPRQFHTSAATSPNPETPVSSLCLHLFHVTVQDARSQAVRNSSKMSQEAACEADAGRTTGEMCVLSGCMSAPLHHPIALCSRII